MPGRAGAASARSVRCVHGGRTDGRPAALTLLVSGRHSNAAAAAAAAWRLRIEAITSRLIRAPFARLAARACLPV